jgi:hypothetical protein
MKVRIEYRDGYYSMRAYISHPRLSYVEVDAKDWSAYQQYLSLSLYWDRFLSSLDNEQYAKDEVLAENASEVAQLNYARSLEPEVLATPSGVEKDILPQEGKK